jgi:trehalose synthase
VGVFSAKDDPEAPTVYQSVRAYAGGDPDIHLFTNPLRVGPLEVNAFQSGSAVILQRSTREGFGLTVTEAMWKGRPVIGRPVGGITVQIRDGQTGFLVETADDCAERIIRLVRDPGLARAIGQRARRAVRRRFLLPRLLLDDLRLFAELAASHPGWTQVARRPAGGGRELTTDRTGARTISTDVRPESGQPGVGALSRQPLPALRSAAGRA